MPPSDSSFDASDLNELGDIVQKVWNSLSAEQHGSTNPDEVARLVMLIAMSGVVDPEEIVRSIVSGTVVSKPNGEPHAI